MTSTAHPFTAAFWAGAGAAHCETVGQHRTAVRNPYDRTRDYDDHASWEREYQAGYSRYRQRPADGAQRLNQLLTLMGE